LLTDIAPLRKILELERNKGYVDSAVIGGLDRFLHRWSGQAIESITNPRLLHRFQKLRLANSRYASLAKEQREQWVDSVLDFLAELERGEVKADEAKSSRRVSTTTSKKQPALASKKSIDSPITGIRGISSSLASKFKKLGVETIRDLLYFFPRRHLDYSQLKSISQLSEGEEQTIIANIWQAQVINQPYLAKNLPTNARVVLSGKVSLFRGRHVFESPGWELVEDRELIHTGRLVPLYPLTQGLYPRQVRKLMKGVIDQWAWQVEDFLPPELKERCNLLGLAQAINQAHYPEDEATKDKARVRLAFDELFLLQLGVLGKKREWQERQPGNSFDIKVAILDTLLKSLPFELTMAQQKVLREILADLQKPKPMSRLLQGEVGSGKTVVAAAALLVAIANGYQGAFMAPTEILAEQHFSTMSELLSRMSPQEDEGYLRSYPGLLPHPVTVALLIGGIDQVRKRELHQRISNGAIDIIIGTHALIQKEVEFHRLGLAVVDEQHRFGVTQRSALRQKGFNPHVLVMTATPIPRTLALTLYGDLDLSVIDQLPPGRQVVKTKWLKPVQRESAYAFIHRQVRW